MVNKVPVMTNRQFDNYICNMDIDMLEVSGDPKYILEHLGMHWDIGGLPTCVKVLYNKNCLISVSPYNLEI
jgi:hypothetical protein